MYVGALTYASPEKDAFESRDEIVSTGLKSVTVSNCLQKEYTYRSMES
jgi:hypothetical protein